MNDPELIPILFYVVHMQLMTLAGEWISGQKTQLTIKQMIKVL